jgi:hypothetical protein
MGANRLLPPVECSGFANKSDAEFQGLWEAHPAKNIRFSEMCGLKSLRKK